MNMQSIKDFLPPTDPPAEKPKEPPKPEPELKKIVIAITNRAPIRIVESHWPLIAHGVSYDCSGSDYEFEEIVSFKVRQHISIGTKTFFGTEYRLYQPAYIIEANFRYEHPAYDPEQQSDPNVNLGRILTGREAMSLWKHMQEVAAEMRERAADPGYHCHVTRALDDAFAKLEPQDLI